MTKTLEQINKELTKLITDNEKEIHKFETELLSIDSVIEKAKQDIVKARKEVNAQAYDDAKRELWTAENTKEMLGDKLQEIRNQPLVTKEKYRELYFQIVAIGDSKIDEVFEKISLVIPELEKASNEHQETTIKVYDNLELLYNIGRGVEEFYRDEQGRIDSSFYGGLSYTPKKNTTNLLEDFIKKYKEIKND